MSESLEQARSQVIHSAAELADKAGGERLEPFLRRYYRHVATEDLLTRGAEDIFGAAMSHRELAADRPVGTANVHVFTPTIEEQGWSCSHTVIEIVTDDMPFLVDSVTVWLQDQPCSSTVGENTRTLAVPTGRCAAISLWDSAAPKRSSGLRARRSSMAACR